VSQLFLLSSLIWGQGKVEVLKRAAI